MEMKWSNKTGITYIIQLLLVLITTIILISEVASHTKVWMYIVSTALLFLIAEANKNRATLDCLTKLPFFKERVRRDIKRLKKGSIIGIIDLNDFKLVNDNYGHRVGDIYLFLFAAEMKKIMEIYKGVKFYRYGGDEFSFIISNLKYDQIMKDIYGMFGKEIVVNDGIKLHIEFCTGAAIYEGDIEAAMHQADMALYDVKKEFKINGSPHYKMAG